MSLAGGIDPHVVAVAIQVQLVSDFGSVGCGLPVLCMEVPRADRQGSLVLAVVNIPVERAYWLAAFVSDGDMRVRLERHREKAIQCLVCTNRKSGRLIQHV